MSLLWLILPFIFIPLIALFAILYIMYRNRALTAIPGPPPIPFFGNKNPGNVQEIYDLIADNVHRYGETSRLYFGPLIRILTCDIEIMEYILKSNVHLKKSNIYDLLKEWIGEGLLIISGERWKRRRKLLTPTFHFSILNDFLVTMNQSSTKLVKKLSEQTGETSVNILNFTQQYSLDIIAETSMSAQLKTLEKGNIGYLKACNSFMELNMERAFHFWQSIPVLYKLFSKDAGKVKDALKVLHDMSKGVIAQKHDKEENGNAKKSDSNEFGVKRKRALIDTLFEYRVQEGFTDEDIQAEVDTFMFEGFDTVSRALAFALYDLGQNPGVQSKLYAEIIATFGEEVENLSQKQINELPYLDMVVKEVLRLHSSVPFIERKLEQDATIGGKFFPKDTVFTLLLHWMNWNPKYFPDPEKFDPERFSPENARKIPNFAYVPFSAGPRNCIGQRFATMELKLAIVHLLKDLEILPVPGHKLNLVYSSLLESSTGILIRIAKRNKN